MLEKMSPSAQTEFNPWRVCTAPMMELSDSHCRYFWRLISRHARLYTEMITTGALLHGRKERFLHFHPAEHPIALQVGGSDPAALAQCATLAQQAGFDEINLNCGCPSDRVQEGRIGACLMAEPELVAECVSAMKSAVDIPVTVKHRLGIDHQDSQEALVHFVQCCIEAGCDALIVHARKAWLKGLSPKENREVPPLQYERVYELKRRFPHTPVVLNGGLDDIAMCQSALTHVDGVMLGRAAYHNPYLLSQVDSALFASNTSEPERRKIVQAYIRYCDEQMQQGAKLHHLTRHILGIFASQPGGRLFRRYLSEHATRPDAKLGVLQHALDQIMDYQHRFRGSGLGR